MIVGIGVDVVDVQRFTASLARTPGLADKLFTEAERQTPTGTSRSQASLAARFAAKEAVAKAVGGGGGMAWTDAEVVVDAVGRPSLVITGAVRARAEGLGITHWHLSLSHDGGAATATVIAERV